MNDIGNAIMHIKTASNGRKKIIMSKSEWLDIGKRAGWSRLRRNRPSVSKQDKEELDPGTLVKVDGRTVNVKEYLGEGVYIGHDVKTNRRVYFERTE